MSPIQFDVNEEDEKNNVFFFENDKQATEFTKQYHNALTKQNIALVKWKELVSDKAQSLFVFYGLGMY